MEMSVTSILLLLIFTFGASFVQRVTGFGFGIFIMAILPHILPSYGEATTLSGFLALIGVCITGFRVRKFLVWKKLLPILLTFILVSYAGVRIVAVADGGLLKHILGALLVLASLYFLFVSGKFTLPPSIPVQIGMGTLSGFMGGMFAMQGPPAVIYFLACTEKKDEYIALCSFYFIFGNLFMTIFRGASGFITPTVCKAWLAGLPAVFLGLYVGGLVYKKMPVETMRKCVYVFIGISGAVSLVL